MELFPAIDLRGGRCVRLAEGDFDRQTVYWDDPVEVAAGFAAAGARWVHMVDLDAARTGQPANRAAIVAVASATGLSVQAGGGVRSLDDAASLLDAGVTRVVLGTAAVTCPELVGQVDRRWPGGAAVGVDHRGGEVRLRGWVEDSGRRVAELVPEAVEAGASAVIVTDIGRDGTLGGPDVVGLAGLLELTGAPLIASGGVASLDDLRALGSIRSGGDGPSGRERGDGPSGRERGDGPSGRERGDGPSGRERSRGLAGVVVGKALYEGRFDVAAALAACAAFPAPRP